MLLRSWLAVGLLMLGVTVGAAPQPSVTREVHDLLRRLGIPNSELAALERGEPIAQVLDTDRRQVAVAGAVRVRARRDRLAPRFRDLSTLAKSGMVFAIGKFSATPSPHDLAPLEFEAYDIESIRECAPGDCAVRLPASSLPTFQSSVNWRSPGWRADTARVWKEVLAQYAAAYAARGESALAEYRNKEEPLRVRDEFAILFRDSSTLDGLAPALMRYVREYPAAPPAGVENVLYWAKEDFGVRPVTSISHRISYSPPDSPRAFIATKQIYATHYFDAGLGFTVILEDGHGGSYLVLVNRVRTRSLTSIFRTFVRSTVQKRSREGVEKILRNTKDWAETGQKR